MDGLSRLALGGKEVGMAWAILRLRERGPRKNGACLRCQCAVCPQTKSSPLESSPCWVLRRGQLWKWPQEAAVIILADCERRMDKTSDSGSY